MILTCGIYKTKAEIWECVTFLTEFALLSYNYEYYSLIGYCEALAYQCVLIIETTLIFIF